MTNEKEEFESKYIFQLTFDEPIKFGTLEIKPVTLKDYYNFMFAVDILMIKKDRIPDAKVIQMSYMEYISYLMLEEKGQEQPTRTLQLYMLFKILFGELNNFGIEKDKFGRPAIYVNDFHFTHKQFDEFKDIVLFQNILSYTGIDLNPELEEEIQLADRLRAGNKKTVNLEKQIASLCVETGYTLETIKNMTIRKFFILQDMKDKEISYKIQTLASMTGLVKFNESPRHYLQEDNKDPLEDKLISYNSLKQKLNH